MPPLTVGAGGGLDRGLDAILHDLRWDFSLEVDPLADRTSGPQQMCRSMEIYVGSSFGVGHVPPPGRGSKGSRACVRATGLFDARILA